MKKHIGKITIQIIATACVLLGIVGLFLPFLQGIFFLVVGLYLFSLVSPQVKERLRIWGTQSRMVRNILSKMEHFSARLRRWFHLG